MNSIWFDCTLDDVLEFKNGKSLSNSCYIETGEYPVWGSNGMIAHCEKPLNFEPVIVIGRVGAYCGSINLVTESNWVTDNAIYATAKDGNDLKFLYYLLISLDIPHTAIGSAQPLLTQSGLRVLKCKVPPLETQREIAHILGTLDDKIELNRKMNKTLEEIAQALYKHWFIDFEFPNAEGKPYKSSGGEMVDSELGLIPKGWRVGKLSDEFDITMGQSPPGDTYNQLGDGLPFYQGNADFGFRYPKNRVYCTVPKRFAQAGDTLISVRAPVGDVNICIEKSIIGRGLASIQHKHRKSSYTYYFVKAKAQDLRSYDDSGTVFGCITKTNIGSIYHAIPNIDIVDKYNAYTTITDSLIHSLHIQTDILSQSKKIYTLEML